MTTIPISGQRERVNTVHIPEEKFKAEFVFFHRKCLLKANEDCDVRDRTAQRDAYRCPSPLKNSLSHCSGQDGKSQVRTAAFKRGRF